MEEKERYEWNSPYDSVVRDNKNDDIINAIERLNEQDKRIKELEQENQQLKQSQKQLAIEELKKVKEYNHTLSLGGSPYVDVFIDNQIKELKGESKGDVGE